MQAVAFFSIGALKIQSHAIYYSKIVKHIKITKLYTLNYNLKITSSIPFVFLPIDLTIIP